MTTAATIDPGAEALLRAARRLFPVDEDRVARTVAAIHAAAPALWPASLYMEALQYESGGGVRACRDQFVKDHPEAVHAPDWSSIDTVAEYLTPAFYELHRAACLHDALTRMDAVLAALGES